MMFRLLLVLPVIFFASCNSNTRSGSDNKTTTEINTEKETELKEQGAAIAGLVQQALAAQLQQAIQEGGVAHALQFCSVHALPITDSVSKIHHVEVHRVSHKPRNPLNKANTFELQLITKMQAALAQQQTPEPELKLQSGKIKYYQPIMLLNPLCLKCHGKAGEDISEEDLKTIQTLYPDDSATGFALNELRGLWRVEFINNALNP